MFVYDTFAYRRPFGNSVSHTAQMYYTESGAADERSENVWYTGSVPAHVPIIFPVIGKFFRIVIWFPVFVYDTFACGIPSGPQCRTRRRADPYKPLLATRLTIPSMINSMPIAITRKPMIRLKAFRPVTPRIRKSIGLLRRMK